MKSAGPWLTVALAATACSTGRRAGTVPAPVTSPGQAASGGAIPSSVPETPGCRRAVGRGPRTRSGEPGPRYSTPFARYALRAELDQATRRLTGDGRIRYQNRSP